MCGDSQSVDTGLDDARVEPYVSHRRIGPPLGAFFPHYHDGILFEFRVPFAQVSRGSDDASRTSCIARRENRSNALAEVHKWSQMHV